MIIKTIRNITPPQYLPLAKRLRTIYNHFMQKLISFSFNMKAFKKCSTKQKALYAGSAVVIAAFIALLVARTFFRPVKYIVRVSSVLYDTYIEKAEQQSLDGLPFTFARESDIAAAKTHFFGPVPVVAASITCENTMPLVTEPARVNTTYYPLGQSFMLPTIAADFSSEGSKKDSLLNPNLSMRFEQLGASSAADFSGNGSRALPVDGVYAGQDNYKLTVTKNAVCTVYVEKIANKLNEWCRKNLHSPDSNTTGTSDHKGPVFIASVGDIMVARGTQDILMNDKNGVEKVFTDTLPVLRNNDITIGNLEGVVTEQTKNATKTYTFKFKKAMLPFLKAAGFNYFMQTNNHCYDYGEAGFKDTLAALKEYDIPTSGVGHNAEEAKQFYHKTIDGQTFAIISCGAYPVESTGFNGKTMATATETRAGILWQSDELIKTVSAEKQAGNFVIVNVHGGEEYHFTPSKSQRAFYEQLCDAGADVVFGSHPHVLQKSEWYDGKLIVYSQGNFLFNGMGGMNGATDSEIVRLGIVAGKIAYCEIYPAKLGTTSVSLKK